MNSPQDIIRRKPYLAWYIRDAKKLSDGSVLEHVLNYGNWDDVQEYIKLKGIEETARIFRETRGEKRSNYRPEIADYFSRYFAAYAR